MTDKEWEQFWARFDEWMNNYPRKRCKTCGWHTNSDEPTWEQQQAKIQKMVNSYLKRRPS